MQYPFLFQYKVQPAAGHSDRGKVAGAIATVMVFADSGAQGRSRSAERLACIATSRWRRLRSSSIFIRRWTVAAEVVSGNSMSR